MTVYRENLPGGHNFGWTSPKRRPFAPVDEANTAPEPPSPFERPRDQAAEVREAEAIKADRRARAARLAKASGAELRNASHGEKLDAVAYSLGHFDERQAEDNEAPPMPSVFDR